MQKIRISCLGSSSPETAELLEQQKGQSDKPGAARGFTASFVLPFRREDVFAQIMHAEQPLGLTSPNVSLSMTPPASADKPVAVGCVRKAEFSAPFKGFTVSELVTVEPDKSVTWKQLESDTLVNLVGSDAGAAQVSILLECVASGTSVSLAYEFQSVKVRGPLCVLSPLVPWMLRSYLQRNAGAAWSAEMRRRGFVPVRTLQDGSNAKAIRSEAQKLKDKEEEERIKGKASSKVQIMV